MTDQKVIDLVRLVQKAYSSIGWVKEEDLFKILEEAMSVADAIEENENNYKQFLLNDLKKDLMNLEKRISCKKDQIRQKRLECKNYKHGWLRPMLRGTIETMEETLKVLQERKEILEGRIDTLKSDLDHTD